MHLLDSRLSGPVNLAGPAPATSDRITHALANRIGRDYRAGRDTGSHPGMEHPRRARRAGQELLLDSREGLSDAPRGRRIPVAA